MARWIINSIAALLLLTGLWSLLNLKMDQSTREAVKLRELNTVILPSPPPPSSQAQLQQSVAAKMELSLQSEAIALKVTELEVTMPELTSPVAISHASLESKLNFDIQTMLAAITTFRLDELDNMPKLLTPISVRLPSSLRQQGIHRAQVQLRVIIHESGQVELVAVHEMDYAELNTLVPQIIKQARFTSPRREGVKVKAEFLWPLKVSA